MGPTSGFLDAFVLYEVLAAVIKELVPESLLDEYAVRRKAVWTDVVSPTATRLKQLVFDPPDGVAV